MSCFEWYFWILQLRKGIVTKKIIVTRKKLCVKVEEEIIKSNKAVKEVAKEFGEVEQGVDQMSLDYPGTKSKH